MQNPQDLESESCATSTQFAPRAGLSLLRCRLSTGRRHQIRVHLAARGWPLVGDPTYGEPRWSAIVEPTLAAALRAFPRQALHAWRIAVAHPITGDRLVVLKETRGGKPPRFNAFSNAA